MPYEKGSKWSWYWHTENGFSYWFCACNLRMFTKNIKEIQFHVQTKRVRLKRKWTFNWNNTQSKVLNYSYHIISLGEMFFFDFYSSCQEHPSSINTMDSWTWHEHWTPPIKKSLKILLWNSDTPEDQTDA